MTYNLRRTQHYLESLMVTAVVCFVAPALVAGLLFVLFTLLMLMGHASPCVLWGRQGLGLLCDVLLTFGNGNLWHGLGLMGLVGSLVGVLFDGYTLAHYPQHRVR